MSNNLILLICVFNISSAVLFTLIGFKLGKEVRIIEVKENQTVQIVEKPIHIEYDDEEATEITPEMERAYEAMLRKKVYSDGI